MKLLHTADLHLGAKWGDQSRADDQARVLGEILELCDRHDVDALLVAGDIFADRVEGSVIREAKRLLDRLAPHLRRGRAVILLRGNHDPLALFTLIRTVVAEVGGQHWPLVVADLPDIYGVPGHALQVVAFPYISPAWLQRSVSEQGSSPEERTAGATGILMQMLGQLYARVSPDEPAIFAGHIELRGAQLTLDREIESGYRELWLEPGRLPRFTSYNALGHIHLGQEVRGVGKPTWYAGAPDRMNLGERGYTPRVLLVTTPETPGGVATVESVALTTCTPWVVDELTGEAAVDDFCARCNAADWPCSPLGRVMIDDVPVGRRPLVEARLREVGPRLEILWAAESTPIVGPAGDGFDPHDVWAVVGDYLQRHFADQPERRARLEAAFAELWSEEVSS